MDYSNAPLKRIYESTINGFDMGLHVVDKDLTIIVCNKALEKLSKGRIKAGDIVGKKVWAAFPFLPEKVWREYKRVLRTRKPITTEEATDFGGERIYTETRKIPIIDERGSVSNIITVINDITDRKNAQKALEDSEEHYRSLIELSPEGIAVHQEGKVVLANSAMARILGYKKPAHMVGRKVLSFVHPKDREKVVARIRTVMERGGTGKLAEERFRHKSGSYVPVEVVNAPFTWNGKPAVHVVVRDIGERKLSEEALRLAEERYRSIVENAVVGVFQSTPEGRYMKVNSAMARMYGYRSPHEMMGEVKDIERQVYVNPKTRRLFKRLLKKHGEVRGFEFQAYRKDGSVIWVSEYARTVKDSNGRIMYYEGIKQDITERKLAEERLRDDKRFLTSVFASIQDGISILDRNLVIKRVNPTMERWYAHAMPLVGKKCHDAYHSCARPCRICPSMRTLRGGQAAHDVVPKRGPNGRIVGWLDLYSFPLKDSNTGRMNGVIEYVRDITGRKNAEDELRSVKDHLQAVLDGIEEAIVVIDKGYRIISHNKAFMRSLRRHRKNILGERCFRVIHGYLKPCRQCVVREAFRTGRHAEDVHYHIEGGERIYHETKAYPLKDESGVESQCIYLFRDATERETMYERMRDAKLRLEELNRMKSEFISIASHELRTPLSIIKGYVDVIRGGLLGKTNRQQDEKLERISRNVRHLNRLVEDILDLSRIDAGELKLNPRRMYLGRLVSGVVEDLKPLAAEKGVRLKVGRMDGSVKSRVDPARMKQVLINIIDNAIKFTPGGGLITVTLGRGGRHALLKVRDTGVGIPKSSIDRVFERFYQADSSIDRQYKGVGLGLTICKSIVELHGGEIEIRSRVRRGTLVTVKLPV